MSYQPTSSFSQPSPLSSSVSSLRSSVFLLSSCNDILTQSTNDLPRLRNVLSQTRHFELTPAYKLQQAQESLASELAPAIEQLLSRVERECEKVERKEEGARARAELLSGRIGNGGRDEVSKRAAPKRSARQSMAAGAGGEKALRFVLRIAIFHSRLIGC